VLKQEKTVLKQRADSILNDISLKSEVPDIICDTLKSQIFQDTSIRLGGVSIIPKRDKPIVILDGVSVKMVMLGKIGSDKIKSIDILKSQEVKAI
jgi:hypothetical protein